MLRREKIHQKWSKLLLELLYKNCGRSDPKNYKSVIINDINKFHFIGSDSLMILAPK